MPLDRDVDALKDRNWRLIFRLWGTWEAVTGPRRATNGVAWELVGSLIPNTLRFPLRKLNGTMRMNISDRRTAADRSLFNNRLVKCDKNNTNNERATLHTQSDSGFHIFFRLLIVFY